MVLLDLDRTLCKSVVLFVEPESNGIARPRQNSL